MNFTKIKVPYLDRKTVERKADLFRQKHWDDSLPVDIERIIDVKLKIDIISLPNLFKFCDMDALITSDWQFIYIDEDRYLDSRHQNRLRFSLAHEIGHLVLHKKVWEKLGIKSSVDFYNAILQMLPEQYGFIETQANKFAAFLLVPRKRLIIEKEKSLEEAKKIGQGEEFLNSYVIRALSGIFGVSEKTIEIRLNNP